MIPREHQLKTWPAYFERVMIGDKTFEVRRNDRDFQRGDVVRLMEFDPAAKPAMYGAEHWMGQGYTGREVTRTISYVLHGGQFGIEPGYAVLGLGKEIVQYPGEQDAP